MERGGARRSARLPAKIRRKLTQGSDTAGIGGYHYVVSGGGVSESFEARAYDVFGNVSSKVQTFTIP